MDVVCLSGQATQGHTGEAVCSYIITYFLYWKEVDYRRTMNEPNFPDKSSCNGLLFLSFLTKAS